MSYRTGIAGILLYSRSHSTWLSCQLVWQEANVWLPENLPHETRPTYFPLGVLR